MGMLSAARLRLYHLLFDQNRRSGRRFEGLCGLFALLSVLVIFIESGLGTQYHLTLDEWHIFVWLELLVTAVFTEYLLRIATPPNPLHYIFSFWGLIDTATILPLYVMWLWPEISLNYVFAAGNAGDPRAAYSQTTALYAFAQRILASDCQRAPSADPVLFVYRHCDGDFRLVNVSD